ncbi:MAG: hypothetical protein KF812_10950 [Fimbriimonadaceae bacterium]|nr:hypothetical protein [Fimbriimonadaceae bacterium]
MRRAVIDVGSNSCLLSVSEFRENRWLPAFERSIVTALGEGTKQSRKLSQAGAQKTLRALSELFRDAQIVGASETRAFGTMALRIADDSQEFLSACLAQDTPLEILSGEDEARFGFEAVANDPGFLSKDRISIVDPGGHSTELVTADRSSAGWNVRFSRSYPVGALGLRETHLPNESPDFASRLAAVSAIDELIGLEYRPHECGRVVVLGATGTNLITIREGMTEWNPASVHGARLDYEEVGRAVGWLCDMTDEERSRVPGLETGRERTLHVGALILERFLFALHTLDCAVSVRGWRHAVLESGFGFTE